MQENYTRQGQEAIKIAEQTAKRYKHNYVGTEHLLMGLLKQKDGTAGAVLAEFHVEEERLAGLIDKLIAPPADVLTEGPRGYTPVQRGFWRRGFRKLPTLAATRRERSIFSWHC